MFGSKGGNERLSGPMVPLPPGSTGEPEVGGDPDDPFIHTHMPTKQQKTLLKIWFERALYYDLESVISMTELYNEYKKAISSDSGSLPIHPKTFATMLKTAQESSVAKGMVAFAYKTESVVIGLSTNKQFFIKSTYHEY